MATLWIRSAGDVGATLSPQDRARGVKISMLKADDFVAKMGIANVDALLIDAEGHEEKILKGAHKILSRARILLVEVHQSRSPGIVEKIDAIASFFGFKKSRIEIESIEDCIIVNLYLKKQVQESGL